MKSNRRSFIKKVGLASAGALVSSAALASETKNITYLKRVSTSPELSKIRIALIGAGGMGTEDAMTALSHENIEMIGVCDLYDGNLEKAKKKWGGNLFTTRDYKDILKRSDVDAVIIGTPDHWHKQISIDALNAGKHAYCEKPMVHSVKEGHEVIKAWQKSKKVFQVGSQGLSSLGNEKAKQLLAEGAIGDLNYAEGFWARHSPEGAWQYHIPEDASPTTVDWKRYISNTVDRPFDAMRFFRWRNYLDYGTAMSGDLFVHLFSSLHFITNSKGPNQISAMGGLRYWKDKREVPDVLLGMFQYPDSDAHPGFNLSLRCNFVDGTSGTTYLRLVGSEGSMNVEWERVTVQKNANVNDDDPFLKQKMAPNANGYADRKKMIGPKEIVYNAEGGYKGAHYDHFANFFHAIRTNGAVVEDPVFGFRAAAPALLCNDSYFGKKYINWDPEKMEVIS
ncbi:MAG: Gfo/Idh/MocA family oxidoreductase [Cyclobacteriaceae bacterium]